jgi:hypothetical protein
MTDLYYIIELIGGKETWRSQGYAERRLAERLARMKQKMNPDKEYKLELRQPEKAFKY